MFLLAPNKHHIPCKEY